MKKKVIKRRKVGYEHPTEIKEEIEKNIVNFIMKNKARFSSFISTKNKTNSKNVELLAIEENCRGLIAEREKMKLKRMEKRKIQ